MLWLKLSLDAELLCLTGAVPCWGEAAGAVPGLGIPLSSRGVGRQLPVVNWKALEEVVSMEGPSVTAGCLPCLEVMDRLTRALEDGCLSMTLQVDDAWLGQS